jgi:hypothetical protein
MRDFDPTASEFITSGYLDRSSRKYDPASIGIAGAVAPLVGGLMGSDASSNASNAQVQSADKATQLQRDIFNQQRQDQAPFRDAGLTAQNRLMYLYGLSPQGGNQGGGLQSGGAMPSAGGMTSDGVQQQLPGGNSQGTGQVANSLSQNANNQPGMDANALRASLLSQYTTQGAGYLSGASGADQTGGTWVNGTNTVDENGLNSAIQAKLSQQQQNQQSQTAQGGGANAPTDPAYGSLMRDFSGQDLKAGMDPGYQFRLDQGNQGLDRSAAARGGLLSGAAMKAAMDYNQGSASQEYGAAFNRFQTNRSNKINPLQSLMGAGQSATNQVAQSGQNFGNQASQNIMGAGNARASGYMGQANALAGGIGQGYNNYNQQNMMNRLFPNSGSSYGGNSGGGTGYENWQTSGNGMPPGF